MKFLSIKSITVKKYRPTHSKNKVNDKDKKIY